MERAVELCKHYTTFLYLEINRLWQRNTVGAELLLLFLSKII